MSWSWPGCATSRGASSSACRSSWRRRRVRGPAWWPGGSRGCRGEARAPAMGAGLLAGLGGPDRRTRRAWAVASARLPCQRPARRARGCPGHLSPARRRLTCLPNPQRRLPRRRWRRRTWMMSRVAAEQGAARRLHPRCPCLGTCSAAGGLLPHQPGTPQLAHSLGWPSLCNTSPPSVLRASAPLSLWGQESHTRLACAEAYRSCRRGT